MYPLSENRDPELIKVNCSLPKESPLDMPRHQVNEQVLPNKFYRQRTAYNIRTFFSRLLIFTGTVALSVYGVTETYGVVSTNSVTNLQWVFLVLVSINFIWISFAFAQALTGFLFLFKPLLIKHPEAEVTFKTAILIPIYNEDPVPIRIAIQSMRNGLLKRGPGKYDFFILSDTNSAQEWIAEEHEFLNILNNVEQGCPVYYRRRSKNTESKAGNIAEWVQRWGGDYEAMIILDADSIMSAESIDALTRRLAAVPGVGLIQTLPTIINANSLYGRLQQFANNCYGPIYAQGLSAWHGLSSNYWGHNAIIRTRAFADSCSLPILPGKPPFGGPVLSHDFIEAALLRRAGWGVRFDTDIKSSYEQAPPSLLNVMIRDRRWCQGNLQHSSFLFAQGLILPSRIHLFSGLMSYLSAVFWLSLILVGLLIAIQSALVSHDYFAYPSLFPTWPVFDAERAQRLFIIAIGILLAPKALGLFASILNIRRCRQFGGPILLILSITFEIVMSALYAPILMVSQVGAVVSIFRGKGTDWIPQSRKDGLLSWKNAAQGHLKHTIFGCIIAVIALLISKEIFYWLSPITIGLMLSIPLSWLSGRNNRLLFDKLSLLQTSIKDDLEHILAEMKHELDKIPVRKTKAALSRLLSNEPLCAWHIAQLSNPSDSAQDYHPPAVTGEWKMRHAHNLTHLETWLDPAETMALLSNPECISQMKKIDK